jgi:hypothetical protein
LSCQPAYHWLGVEPLAEVDRQQGVSLDPLPHSSGEGAQNFVKTLRINFSM